MSVFASIHFALGCLLLPGFDDAVELCPTVFMNDNYALWKKILLGAPILFAKLWLPISKRENMVVVYKRVFRQSPTAICI